ncbi:hypothetical protein [Lysobacter soyae]|uniref:Uncharacterized protein n=1 Tax=Lysobacter soyae TaxID=2764185 RepID=A0ABX8WL96_9GAMM|nr:hypothetical protein [Lysobacter sp. CJ11]QYR52396.1 hypothetical protein H8L67_07260 [Lysobacter sp. CJ11]
MKAVYGAALAVLALAGPVRAGEEENAIVAAAKEDGFTACPGDVDKVARLVTRDREYSFHSIQRSGEWANSSWFLWVVIDKPTGVEHVGLNFVAQKNGRCALSQTVNRVIPKTCAEVAAGNPKFADRGMILQGTRLYEDASVQVLLTPVEGKTPACMVTSRVESYD